MFICCVCLGCNWWFCIGVSVCVVVCVFLDWLVLFLVCVCIGLVRVCCVG